MQNLSDRLLNLVRQLDCLGSKPSLIELAHALTEAKLTPADVAAFVQTNARSYNRASVVFREAYDLMVMTWLPGQSSVPHDHSGSICVMQVMQGKAVEGCYQVAADGYVDLQYETVVPPGAALNGQDAGVHTVRNPSLTDEVLVTVHVYAPPLKDFRQFTPRPHTTVANQHVSPDGTPTVLVVGGGFSGSIAAAQVLRRAHALRRVVKVVLVERRGAIGEGPAYGTRESFHLLNVRAGGMSAWPDRPNDFLQWAIRHHGPAQSNDFLPRQWYGEYVRETLLKNAHAGREYAELAIVFDEVRRVARHPAGGWMAHMARASSLRAEAVILAIGHRPPSDPLGPKWSGPRARFLAEPWRPFAMNVVRPDDPVVILGTGLTAVDAVLSLTQQPRTAPITLLSRNGLLPQAHTANPVVPADLGSFTADLIATPGGVRAHALLRTLRRRIRELAAMGVDWRAVVNGLRSHTATLWRSMPPKERRRFLSRLRPFWEIHRHRMAPEVAEHLRGLLERGEMRLMAGRVESAQADGEGVRLLVRERLTNRVIEVPAAWIINCTGPVPSNSAEANPVIGRTS